jgi:cytoskeletal protein CcmA (bactofilin family)
VVGETGEIEAEVNVGTLSVSGRVTGTVRASEKIEVHPKGKVFGDLSLEKPNLIIHEGGVFEGKIEMGGASRASSSGEGADTTRPLGDVEMFGRSS